MKVHQQQQLAKLCNRLAGAQRLIDEREYPRARSVIAEVECEAAALGHRSAHLAWMLGVVTDYLGNPREAIVHFEEALRLEPLGCAYLASRKIAANRIRGWLARADLDPGDPEIPLAYACLLERDLADLPAHLAMARHHEARGEHAQALRLLEAAAVLHPAAPELWEALARNARATGNEALAAEAESHLACTEPSSTAWSERAVAPSA